MYQDENFEYQYYYDFLNRIRNINLALVGTKVSSWYTNQFVLIYMKNHSITRSLCLGRYNSTPASPNEARLGARGETAQRHNSSPDTGLVGDQASKL